ncbi:MAG: metallophosphoesterase, partial [Mesorhizobium sp.]
YNLFEIDGEKGGWSIRLTRRGLTGPALPPSDLQVIELGADTAAARELVRS